MSALGGARFAVRFVPFLGDIAQALGAAGEIATGLAEVDEAVGRFRQVDENWLTTDMLRCKGELLFLQDESGAAVSSEKLFREALDQARLLGALSWELCAATSLARLKCGQGRTADALSVLQPVYDRLTEGFETVDVIAARRLFGGLSGVTSRR